MLKDGWYTCGTIIVTSSSNIKRSPRNKFNLFSWHSFLSNKCSRTTTIAALLPKFFFNQCSWYSLSYTHTHTHTQTHTNTRIHTYTYSSIRWTIFTFNHFSEYKRRRKKQYYNNNAKNERRWEKWRFESSENKTFFLSAKIFFHTLPL